MVVGINENCDHDPRTHNSPLPGPGIRTRMSGSHPRAETWNRVVNKNNLGHPESLDSRKIIIKAPSDQSFFHQM